MGDKYSIGIDFGTLSARAILINNRTGEEILSSVYGYQDGVIEKYLNSPKIKLPLDYALQNPLDYKDAVIALLKDLTSNSGLNPSDIISIGLDFTACTVMAVDEKMTPLCVNCKFSGNPHSWVKLWKHHGAQEEADRINKVAIERNEKFLKYYGNTSSSEWMLAKILETYRKAPEVYQAATRFVEAGDWVVWLLTGEETTSTCMAGYKAFWNAETGYPSAEYLEAVEPGFSSVLGKLTSRVSMVGSRAGGMTEKMAAATGLIKGTSVAVAMIDAHSPMPLFASAGGNILLMSMGTSSCHILLSKKEILAGGICGVVRDGVIPGYYGYEAGQAAVGDIYDWFITNLASNDCYQEASKRNISPFAVMDEKAANLEPGKSGLIALDWWNGNRSMLNNSNLSGMIVGLTLNSSQEELYRAIIEATAYGTRNIIEAMENQGIQIDHIYACGGLSRKSALVMQIFADVIGREIATAAIEQTTAFGAAMYGMIAAGKSRGGYDSFGEMGRLLQIKKGAIFRPNKKNHKIYNELFAFYQKLADHFGIYNKDIMESLKKMRTKRYAERKN